MGVHTQSTTTWVDAYGHTHYCPKREYPCLGVLFSCGHSYYCSMEPDAIDHSNRVHFWDKVVWMFFSISVLLAIGLWLAIRAGLVK